MRWAAMFGQSCCFIGGNSFMLADFSTFFTGCTKWGKFWSNLFLMLCIQQAGTLEHWWSSRVLYKLRWHCYNVVVLFCAALQTSHQLTPWQETRNLTCTDHWKCQWIQRPTHLCPWGNIQHTATGTKAGTAPGLLPGNAKTPSAGLEVWGLLTVCDTFVN